MSITLSNELHLVSSTVFFRVLNLIPGRCCQRRRSTRRVSFGDVSEGSSHPGVSRPTRCDLLYFMVSTNKLIQTVTVSLRFGQWELVLNLRNPVRSLSFPPD